MRLFPEAVLKDTAHWATYFGRDWRQEMPLRIHGRDLADDGSPQWHPDFEKWLLRTNYKSDGQRRPYQSRRTTRAMRRLRKIAPREYEVLYRLLILSDSVEGITVWLNERAARNHVPLPEGQTVHYRIKDTLALIIAGTSHVKALW